MKLIYVLSSLQFNDAEFEDVKFFVYSVNDADAEIETIEVCLKQIIALIEFVSLHGDQLIYKCLFFIFRRPTVIMMTLPHLNIGFCQIANSKVNGNFCTMKTISKKTCCAFQRPSCYSPIKMST